MLYCCNSKKKLPLKKLPSWNITKTLTSGVAAATEGKRRSKDCMREYIEKPPLCENVRKEGLWELKGWWATKAGARTELQCYHFLPHKWELKSRRESVKIIDKPKKVEKNFRGRTACETTFKRKSKEKACLLEFGLHEDLELWRIRKKLERIEDPERVWLWEAVAMKNGGGSKADEAMQGEKIKKNH